MISHNKLVRLPDAINQLRNLEILDCSFNQLIEINQLKCMAHLRILNISGNGDLNIFPTTLSTCDSLVDIIFDVETFVFPPSSVLEQGTIAILNYLTTNRNFEETDSLQLPIPKKDVHVSRDDNDSRNLETFNDFGKEKVNISYYWFLRKCFMFLIFSQKFIELERLAMEKNKFQEEELHQKLQVKREGVCLLNWFCFLCKRIFCLVIAGATEAKGRVRKYYDKNATRKVDRSKEVNFWHF